MSEDDEPTEIIPIPELGKPLVSSWELMLLAVLYLLLVFCLAELVHRL